MTNRLSGAAGAAVHAAVTEILNGDDVGAHNELGDLDAGDLLTAVEAIEKLGRIGRDLLGAKSKSVQARREAMRLVHASNAPEEQAAWEQDLADA